MRCTCRGWGVYHCCLQRTQIPCMCLSISAAFCHMYAYHPTTSATRMSHPTRLLPAAPLTPLHPPSHPPTHANSYIGILGLLLPGFSYTGMDGPAHMSEETVGAAMGPPLAIMAGEGPCVRRESGRKVLWGKCVMLLSLPLCA